MMKITLQDEENLLKLIKEKRSSRLKHDPCTRIFIGGASSDGNLTTRRQRNVH